MKLTISFSLASAPGRFGVEVAKACGGRVFWQLGRAEKRGISLKRAFWIAGRRIALSRLAKERPVACSQKELSRAKDKSPTHKAVVNTRTQGQKLRDRDIDEEMSLTRQLQWRLPDQTRVGMPSATRVAVCCSFSTIARARTSLL